MAVRLWNELYGAIYFDEKKTLPKFNITKITKIWQQTKYIHFFLTLPKFDKAENGIKVIKPYVQVQPRQTNE